MPRPSDYDIPNGTRFVDTHEYVFYLDEEDGTRARIGISHFAAEQLGDIVYVELPGVGDTFEKEDPFGTVESVKAASDLYMPVSGEVIAVNTQLEEEKRPFREFGLNMVLERLLLTVNRLVNIF